MTVRRPASAWPWELPELAEPEVYAIKALAAGVANDGQQKMALKAIIMKIAATYDMSFRPGGDDGRRATDFAQGKQFVGQRILEVIGRPMKPQGEHNAGPDPTAAAQGRRNPRPAAQRSRPAKPAAAEG